MGLIWSEGFESGRDRWSNVDWETLRQQTPIGEECDRCEAHVIAIRILKRWEDVDVFTWVFCGPECYQNFILGGWLS